MPAPKRRYWLRNRITGVVVQRTAAQAAKPEMEAISEAQAEASRKKLDALRAEERARADAKKQGIEYEEPTIEEIETQEQVEEGLIPDPVIEAEANEPPKQKSLEEMSELELRSYAAENNFPLPMEMSHEECLRQVVIATGQGSAKLDDREDPVKMQPAAPEVRDLPDFSKLKRFELAPYCEEFGVPYKGKGSEIAAALAEKTKVQ